MKNKRIEELCKRFEGLSSDEAKQVDETLVAYLAQDGIEYLKPINYLFLTLSRYIKIDMTKENILKCDELIKMYKSNNSKWLIGENNFCIIAYVFTLFCLCIETFSFTFAWCNDFVSTCAQFGTLMLSLVISIIIEKWFSGKESFELFTKTFNRYIPSITIITFVTFYLVKLLKYVENVNVNFCVFIVILIVSFLSSILFLRSRFKTFSDTKKQAYVLRDSYGTEKDLFKTDIWSEIAPAKGTSYNLIGLKMPTSQDIYFVSKWHELHDRYTTARLFLRKTQEFDYDYWFNQVEDPISQTGIELKIKAELFETALINYNILVDLTWAWTYVSAEYVLYKFDKDNNVINAIEITGMHTIDEAYELLRQTENGVTTPHTDGNPFNYLKKMRPEFSAAVDTIVSFWKDFSNSEIRGLYNFIKHKGKPRYKEIEQLRGGKAIGISINGEQCPSDISDVEKIIELNDFVQKLIEFDDEKLYPYIKELLDNLKKAVNPSPMVY